MKTCPLCDAAYPNHHTSCPTDGALLIESRDLEPGTVIRGKYRVVRLLGHGGMGTVYLAEHILLGQERALKFISGELSQDSRFLKRFRHEAQAAIKLRHPNVVEVVDLDQAENGSPYIAMEYVEGEDLRHALAASYHPNASYHSNDCHPERSAAESKDLRLPFGAFPVERALAIARGIAQGLAAAHAKGIVHRDVKPENILLANPNTPAETPKLLDFGIAAVHETVTAVSRTHGLLLTPPYASPEQWRGLPSEQLDGRADLYALGGVLYEMLTGQTPFHAHNSEGWMFQHLQEQPQPPSHLRPELANWPDLNALVLRLLTKDREDRPKDAAELVGLLDAVRYVAPDARQETVSEDAAPAEKQREIRRSGRVPVWVWTASVLALLAAAFAAGRIFWPKPPATTRSGVTGVPPGLVEEPLPQAQRLGTEPVPPPPAGYKIVEPQPSSQTTGNAAKKSDIFDQAAAEQQRNSKPPDNKGGLTPWDEAAQSQASTLYNQHRYREAAPLLEQACDGGVWEACYDLAEIYEGRDGAPKNYSRAFALFSKACDADLARGCSTLSDIYAFGAYGVEPNIPRAQELARKACLIEKIPNSACAIPEQKQ